MVVLVPWKPIARVTGLLSAMTVVSYFGSALTRSFRRQHCELAPGGRAASCHEPFSLYAQAVFGVSA
jgi:hypothetical protein